MKPQLQLPASLLATIILFLAYGCTTTTYDRTLNPGFDLRTMDTFRTIPLPSIPEWDDTPLSVLASGNFSLESIKSALEAKGFNYLDDGKVDFQIRVRVEHLNRKSFSESDIPELASSWTPAPLPHKVDGSSAREMDKEQQVRAAQRGVADSPETYLIIEAVESASSKVAWRGWAKSGKSRPFKGIEKTSNAVSKILEHFPN